MITLTPELLTYGAAGLAFIAVTALGFAFAGGGDGANRGRQNKRMKAIAESSRGKTNDPALARRKQMEAQFKGLKDKEEAARNNRKAGVSIDDRIRQAGFSFSVSAFWMASVAFAVTAGACAYFAGMGVYVAAGATFAAGLGLPRWLLGMAIKGRQKKFVSQFADAIEVIVRGVKSGLPLNECLKIIAKESPQPLGGEFAMVCDSLAMGVTMDQALGKLYQRTPIQEVNFFVIVLAIQAKAGGNLSEALGNLAGVLRSRKMLREKIKAFSSEAKASAMIIGSLPIIVMLLVYLTTPGYIMSLFTNDFGHLLLLIASGLMATGIYIMRSMINFNF